MTENKSRALSTEEMELKEMAEHQVKPLPLDPNVLSGASACNGVPKVRSRTVTKIEEFSFATDARGEATASTRASVHMASGEVEVKPFKALPMPSASSSCSGVPKIKSRPVTQVRRREKERERERESVFMCGCV
jgi:hypothetical protein